MNASPSNPAVPYRGRFAPSPTGPLHFGSLVAAVGSYLDAKARGGEWLVRMEDLDAPRTVPGAADDILRTLEACGLHWDGAVRYQSTRTDAYRAALDTLQARDAMYPCACSRREIADSALTGIEGPVYPGTCRDGIPAGRAPRALRVCTTDAPVAFTDTFQGTITQNIARDIGDFVVWRADGVFAYQLAVVVDDADQGTPTLCAAPTCCIPRRGKCIFSNCLACPRRVTPICRSPSTLAAKNSRSKRWRAPST